MRRTLFGALLIGSLLFGAIGAALAQGKPRPAAAMGDQCGKFHFTRPEKATPLDFARCARPLLEAPAR